ncbi:MAG: hypothetical protein U0T77_05205 [Chitinophagales bacterium]
MMRLSFLLGSFFITLSAMAENRLLLCTSYNQDGAYSGVFPTWNIAENGSYMHFFYESDVPITDTLSVLIFKIFDRRDTNYYEYDRYYLLPGPSGKWAANKYTFAHPGNYRFLLFDTKKNLLLQTHSTLIEYDKSVYDNKYNDSWYYLNSNMVFCDSVVKGTIIGKSNSFAYKPEGNKVVIYIEQPDHRMLKSDHLFAKIYKMEGDKKKWVKSNSYYTDFNWFWTFIPIYLNEKGLYSVELYNEQDVYINSATLEIK